MIFSVLPPTPPSVRRDEDETLFIVAAWLYREQGVVPRSLSPTKLYRSAAGVDALVSRGVPARVCGEIRWVPHGDDYEGLDAGGARLTMEVKGCQANNHGLYAGDAWRKACRSWTGVGRHRIAVAFADHPDYRRAFGELPQVVRRQMNVWFYIVQADDTVVEVGPDARWPWPTRRLRSEDIGF